MKSRKLLHKNGLKWRDNFPKDSTNYQLVPNSWTSPFVSSRSFDQSNSDSRSISLSPLVKFERITVCIKFLPVLEEEKEDENEIRRNTNCCSAGVVNEKVDEIFLNW